MNIPSRDKVVQGVLAVRQDGKRAGSTQYELRRLRQVLENRKGRFALLFAIANEPKQQRVLTQRLFESTAHNEISLHGENSENLLDALADAPGAPAPLVVYGMERMLPSIGSRAERRERTLNELQYRRERFRVVARPVIIWLPEYAYAIIGQQAADFWSWQSGTFFFNRFQTFSQSQSRLESSGTASFVAETAEFFGREYELARILNALDANKNVALVGPAGIGKTALAKMAAVQATSLFPDGIMYVPLRLVDAQEQPEAALFDVLGQITSRITLPTGVTRLRAIYDDILHNRKVLIKADDVPSADVARLLIPRLPARILMISRELIDAPDTESLDIGRLGREDALRALRSMDPEVDHDLASRLVDISNGSPLLLKLIQRIYLQKSTESHFEKNRTQISAAFNIAIQETIQFYYASLSKSEAELLRFLSVVENPFDLITADKVYGHSCKIDLEKLFGIGFAQSLPNSRIGIHQLVRSFANARMSSEEKWRAEFNLSSHFAEGIARASAAYHGGGSAENLELARLFTEWSNVEQGQLWASENALRDDAAASLCVSYAMAHVGILESRLSVDARATWLKSGVAAAEALNEGETVGELLIELFDLYRSAGDDAQAAECERKALQILESLQRVTEISPLEVGQERALSDRELTALPRNASASAMHVLYARRARIAGKLSDLYYRHGELSQSLRIRQTVELPLHREAENVVETAIAIGKIATTLEALGRLDDAMYIRREEELPIYEQLGDVRSVTETKGKIADNFHTRGDLEEALRIRREEELPVYEQLGDVRSVAVTKGRIADIYHARGDLDEALRIRLEDELPVYERLGEVRSVAVTKGKIADIYQARGDLDEALNIRREETLPVYERLGDIRSIAVTKGKIADIYQARGDLDEALRIRREDELPVYERLGDIRSVAVTKGQIADIYYARGDLEEALRIRREDELPVYERLGDIRSKSVALQQIASLLLAQDGLNNGKIQEIFEALAVSFAIAQQLGLRDGIGGVGLMLGQIMAIGGLKDEALAVLDLSEAAFAALDRQTSVQLVQQVRAAIQTADQ